MSAILVYEDHIPNNRYHDYFTYISNTTNTYHLSSNN